MPSDSYSFLDVAVLDQVRSRFAAGDALAVVSVDLEQVIWANGPGAAIFGYPDIEAIIGASARLPSIARRQIMATSGFPDIGCDRALLIRLATGLTSTAIGFLASAIVMPDGEKAILLCAAAPAGANDTAQRAIGGFTEDGHFVAFVDGVGAIEAASDGFAALDISRATLAALVADVAHERDRIVKRIVPGGANAYPAGMARLTDEPARHLLVVIDEGLLGKTEDRREPGTAAVPEVQGPAEAVSPVAAAGDADRPERSETHQHDHWYFNSEAEAKPAPTGQAAPEKAPPTAAGDPTPTRDIDPAAPPVRFVWRTDADGQFSMISPEFGETVGGPAADVMGRRFKDVAATFDLDPSGEITDLLERRDTWSGRSVLWPVAGTQLRIPVDLAALPVYDRNRTFEGFRGFGVARPADAVADPEQIGLALVPNAPAPADTPDQHMPDDPTPERHDPFRGEVPALTIVPKPERRFADKVIRLAEHRAPANDKGLSTIERSAFREIGERLKKANAPEAAVSAEDSMAAADLRDARDEGEVPGRDSEGEATASAAPAEQQAVAVPSSDSIPPRAPEATVAEVETPPLKAGGFLPSAFATPDRSDAAPDTSILDRLPVPLLIDCADTLHYANDAFLELTGYRSLGELEQTGGLGALFADPYGGDDPSGDEPDDAHRALHLKTREGSQLPIEALLRAVPWRGGKALMLVIRRTGDEDEPASEGVREGLAQPDLMDLPAAMDLPETADLPETVDLKARIAEMRTIIDTATDGVVLIDYDGTIRSISRPAEALFGFDSDEVAGKPFASLFAIESQRAARDYLAGLSEHGVASILNDGREVIGREAQGRFIPLFMTIGRLPNESGFCAVVRDITQWKRAEEDLTQARAVAERASSQKTDFLARISHEIRTPLNAIIGFSELMVDEKFGPVANDRYRDYLRDINRSGNHVLDLVNDLLDISKIEAGQQEMDYEAVSLNDALAETVAMMQPQANRERVIIRSSFASRLPEVVADLRSVRQIALNIVSNAVRYTQAGGQVIVSTAYEPSGDVVMRVRDTGIGMSQSEIEQALKPFKQINALKRGRNDGTGLGLPLTKAMVEANRARFVINSTPGEGTLVEVAFPSTRVLAE